MISKEQVLELLKQNIKSENMIRHSLASESIMSALAEHLNEDKVKWAMGGAFARYRC